jgi:hypothetical protein
VQTDATRTCELLLGLRDVTVLGVDERLRQLSQVGREPIGKDDVGPPGECLHDSVLAVAGTPCPQMPSRRVLPTHPSLQDIPLVAT